MDRYSFCIARGRHTWIYDCEPSGKCVCGEEEYSTTPPFSDYQWRTERHDGETHGWWWPDGRIRREVVTIEYTICHQNDGHGYCMWLEDGGKVTITFEGEKHILNISKDGLTQALDAIFNNVERDKRRKL